MQAEEVRITGSVRVEERAQGRTWIAALVQANGEKTRRSLGLAWVRDSGRKTRRGATVWRAGDGPKPDATYLTPREAQEALDALLDAERAKCRGPRPVDGKTFGDACDEWLNHAEKVDGVEETTLNTYRSIVHKLEAEFRRESPLRRIGATRIGGYQHRLLHASGKAALARTTIHTRMRVLVAILDRARAKGWIGANPADDVELIERPAPDPDFNVLEPHEVEAVARAVAVIPAEDLPRMRNGKVDRHALAAMRERRPLWALTILLLAYTGLRFGELRSLRWRDAADVGAGVYRAVAEVRINQSGEWRAMSAVIVDRLGGRCAPAGMTGDLHEFLYPVPCPTSITDGNITLDTSQLPPGDHLVRAQVEDGAGNRADIVPPRIIHVDEPDRGTALGAAQALPDNGRGASARALVRLARSSRTVGYGARVNVRGRLVDENDRPIAGATIQVDSRRLIPRRGLSGAPWRPLGKVVTSRSGSFTARIPSNLSRALRFAYRASLSQEGFTSAAQFELRTRAHVTFRAKRARLRNGQTAVFVGRVERAPRGGVPLSLQVFVPGRGWIPVQTNDGNPRTGRRGHYRMTYRFARTYVRVNYRFRVVVGEDSAFPFVRTVSRRANVVVGP